MGLGGGGWCLTGFGVLANTLLLGGLGSASENSGGLPNDQAGRKAPGTIDCVSTETATFTQRLQEFQERHPSRHLLNKRAPESVVAGFWNPSQTQELCWVVPCTACFHTREGRATQPAVRRGGSAPSRLNFLESPKLSLSS